MVIGLDFQGLLGACTSLLFPTHPVGGMQGCDGFFHYYVVANYFWLFIEACISSPCWWRPSSPRRRYFYWYIIIGWGRSLTVAWTGSGPMSRMSFVPPSGSSQRRRLGRECCPCLTAMAYCWILDTFLLFSL